MHQERREAAEKHEEKQDMAGNHYQHEKAAAQHDLAAQAHRTAAEHNEKGDDAMGNWHAERALEHSTQAFKLSKEAHTKSDRIEVL